MQIKFIVAGVIVWFTFFLVSGLIAQYSLIRYFTTLDTILMAAMYAALTFSGGILIYYGAKSSKEQMANLKE